jgi:hypothetical protein
VNFTPETVEPFCYNIINEVLNGKAYDPASVTLWIDDICSKCTKGLIEMNKPYKYLGNFLSFFVSYYYYFI